MKDKDINTSHWPLASQVAPLPTTLTQRPLIHTFMKATSSFFYFLTCRSKTSTGTSNFERFSSSNSSSQATSLTPLKVKISSKPNS